MVTVRPATVADAPAMGRLHVRAWQAAYRGHMPDDYRYSTPHRHQLEADGLSRADTARDGQDRLSVTLAVLVDKPHGR